MSTKEMAYIIFNQMSEEQLKAFITLFADENTKARIESEMIANDPNPKLYDSFRDFMNEMEQENE